MTSCEFCSLRKECKFKKKLERMSKSMEEESLHMIHIMARCNLYDPEKRFNLCEKGGV